MKTGGECSGRTADEEGAIIEENHISNLPAIQAACAACKFQRRKCSADCPLAPYFPADRLQDFQNVRRLFGVKNVLKTLGDLDLSKRSEAAKCMIFEANCRAKDLAGGCYRIIAGLQREITLLEAQRQVIFYQLQIYRQTAAGIDLAGSRGGDRVDLNHKPGFSSRLLDSGEWTINDLWNLKEFCSLNGFPLLIKKENEVDFNLQASH